MILLLFKIVDICIYIFLQESQLDLKITFEQYHDC